MGTKAKVLWVFLALLVSAGFWVAVSLNPVAEANQPETIVAGLAWLGPAIPYPNPGDGDDRRELGDTYRIWFAGAGPAKRGDTYPMTWADDDYIYTSSGDPHWGEKATGLDFEKFRGTPPNYYITKVNEMVDYVGNGGEGPKPTGVISVDGVLYLAFQNLMGKKRPVHGTKSQHGSDAAIVASHDHGRTWYPSLREIKEPMFAGSKFGGPSFINFGQDNQGARDEYVYAVSADQWDNGSELVLGRVNKTRILERQAWEWVSAFEPDGSPKWSRELNEAHPVLTRNRQISLPEMVYLHAIQRYLLLTWRLKQDFSPEHGSELTVYEAREPWGPFRLVHREESWEDPETTPYCPRLPLKWLKQSENEVSGWLQFSGSWRENSKHYRSHVRPFRFIIRRR